MKESKNMSNLLRISIAGFLLMSLTFLLMPLNSTAPEEGTDIFRIIVGVLFWLFLIIGIAAQIMLSKEFKKSEKKKAKRRIGLFSFLQNREAAVFDLLCLIGFIAIAFMVLFTDGTMYFAYICTSVFVFSFCMHCILNGKIYNTLKRKPNAKKKSEKEEKNNDKIKA